MTDILDTAFRKLDDIALDLSSMESTGDWGLGRTFNHLAQGVEFSMTGYPKPKPKLFQMTAGKLAFAGPMSDESGEEMQGMGMMVYRAASFEEARALAENDPMHKAGARRYTLRKWMINEGSLTLSVGLSGQSVDFS